MTATDLPRTPLASALAADPTVLRARDQRYIDAINRARATRLRRLRRRFRDLDQAYRSGVYEGPELLDLAATVMVLHEQRVRVPTDHTVDRVLEAALVVDRTYRYSTDPYGS